jgi:hypothetical protein
MNAMFFGATDFEQTLCWDLMSDSETDSMFDGSSGGLDPKCGKCIAATVYILGRLHRLLLQCTNADYAIPLVVPHLHPFVRPMPQLRLPKAL